MHDLLYTLRTEPAGLFLAAGNVAGLVLVAWLLVIA